MTTTDRVTKRPPPEPRGPAKVKAEHEPRRAEPQRKPEPNEALELFRANPSAFDAVITDLSMPRMPGAELVRAIRQIRSDIPVIMASGYIRPEDHEAAERLGVTELISKPADFKDLTRRLHRLLTPDLASQKI